MFVLIPNVMLVVVHALYLAQALWGLYMCGISLAASLPRLTVAGQMHNP